MILRKSPSAFACCCITKYVLANPTTDAPRSGSISNAFEYLHQRGGTQPVQQSCCGPDKSTNSSSITAGKSQSVRLDSLLEPSAVCVIAEQQCFTERMVCIGLLLSHRNRFPPPG
jgi:hypothetical protein